MTTYYRRSAPKVRSGTVQWQNRWEPSPHYFDYTQETLVIDRLRPGRGYRHVLRKVDIENFIGILPEWSTFSEGLDAIVLASGNPNSLGWYRDGVAAICAWTRELDGIWDQWFVQEHHDILVRLGVERTPNGKNLWHLAWTEASIRAFQLMHILLHELGHHHDLMTTRSQRYSSRGEQFAEDYATNNAEALWPKYFDVFGW